MTVLKEEVNPTAGVATVVYTIMNLRMQYSTIGRDFTQSLPGFSDSIDSKSSSSVIRAAVRAATRALGSARRFSCVSMS